ncbi:hypothetical protein KCTCHS21_09860 [Cohnella abietis]|uniref:ABC transmembrane type-1 domain-containing protein n=1 Tax=Cohnella abietis TaxID=2507935 RepID=A0A3T1D0E9_9BACL|nr:hypothetical protein KCTCHS21_09860 [Cohnella abietis]
MFFIVISTIMLPGIIAQIPTYVLFNKFGLLNSFLPWVLWGLGGNAFFIFLYRQFFAGIPKDLEDAARIDGCSSLSILFRIFLPISIPVLITTSIMAFNNSWGGDYLTPYMFLQEDKYPLVTALIQIGYVMPGNPGIKLDQILYAAVVMFVVPSVVIFIIGQRYMVDGFVNSGIKG